MVRDINPGRGSSGIQSVVAFRGELYFGANDGVHGFELWKSDGTKDGTVLVTDLNPGPNGSALFSLRASGDRLYFSESSYICGKPAPVYTTDGTASGTHLLRQFVTQGTSSISFEGCFGWPPGEFLSLGALTYFIASDGVSGLQLWRTDGTALGTAVVKNICPGGCTAFLFSDGVLDMGTPVLQVIKGRLFFFANDGIHGREPWTSDGTEAGTRLVKDVFPGPIGSADSTWGYGLTVVGAAVVFPSGVPGDWELWRSDGTEAGTFPVGAFGSQGRIPIVAVGDTVFFTAAQGSGNRRTGTPPTPSLWKTDSAGTQAALVSDSVSDPTGLVNFGGTLYFMAPGPAGYSLWKTDGSAPGTQVVRVVGRESISSNPQPIGELDGSLLFFANGGKDVSALWRSDGTDAGTQAIAPLILGSGWLDPTARFFAPFRESLFFNADDGIHGFELWRTDGTPEGTRLVKDIAVSSGARSREIWSSNPCALTAFEDALYFGAGDGNGAQGLWKTDGTEIGTEFIKDLDLYCSSGRPAGLVPFNGLLYFSARTPSIQYGLWRTNGTGSGTELVRPVMVANLTATNGKLIFAGSQAPEGNGLWASDGTAAGTVILQPFNGNLGPFARSADAAFFLAPTPDSRNQLWRTDGTRNGTTVLTDFNSGLFPSEVVPIGNRVFFTGEDAAHGVELWTSDGTPAGTHIVKDIAAGEVDSSPRNLTAVGGVLLFSARDPIHGEELWQSDGTEEGTFLVQDISPGPASSSPRNFMKAGSLIYFTADDGESGAELWSMPLSALASSPRQKPHRVQDLPWRH
jgi:ELWxxDGT repeat protein